MELQRKDLQEDYKEQSFKWMNDTWAAFAICPIIKKGRIHEVWIYPKHQPEATNYYVITNEDGWEGIDFGCFLKEDKKLEFPQIQETYFCKEHKSHSFYLLVPKESKAFFISTGLSKCCINWR